MAESVINSFFPSQVASDQEKMSAKYGLRVGRAIQDEWFKSDSGTNRYKSNQNTFHQACLSFNYISVILFTICYIIELKRENWCVEYLDINKDFSDNHLENVIGDRPELKKQIMTINNRYYISTRITMGFYVINLILSSIYIFFKSLGLTTLTSYLSFVLLIVMKF